MRSDEFEPDCGDAARNENAGFGGHGPGPGNVSRRSIGGFYRDPTGPASWRRQGGRGGGIPPAAVGVPLPRTQEPRSMTLNRWKILACTLTIGVGGLAVFATPPAGDKADAGQGAGPASQLT